MDKVAWKVHKSGMVIARAVPQPPSTLVITKPAKAFTEDQLTFNKWKGLLAPQPSNTALAVTVDKVGYFAKWLSRSLADKADVPALAFRFRDLYHENFQSKVEQVYEHMHDGQGYRMYEIVGVLDEYIRLHQSVVEIMKWIEGCVYPLKLGEGLPTLKKTLDEKGLFVSLPLYQCIVSALLSVETKWKLMKKACDQTVEKVAADMNTLANGARANDTRSLALLLALKEADPGQLRQKYEDEQDENTPIADFAFAENDEFVKSLKTHDIKVSLALVKEKQEVRRLQRKLDDSRSAIFHVLNAVTLLASGQRQWMTKEWNIALPLLRPILDDLFGDQLNPQEAAHPLDVLTHFFEHTRLTTTATATPGVKLPVFPKFEAAVIRLNPVGPSP